MTKRYLDHATFGAAIRHLEQHHDLRVVRGPHWTDWYIGNTQVASVCDSPHPGPYYGSWRWVDHDLTRGAEVVVRRFRSVNATEAHIINERIQYMRQYGRPIPADKTIRLIPEVERTFDAMMNNGGFKHRVGIGSFDIHWSECVRLP